MIGSFHTPFLVEIDMLRKNFTLVCSWVGLALSAAALVTINASPVLGTNCNLACGPPSNACSGSSSAGCTGSCGGSGFSGSVVNPTGASVNGTTAGNTAPTTTNVACLVVTPCTTVPVGGEVCTLGVCVSTSALGALCSTSGLGTPSTLTYPNCVPGACSEG